MNKILTSPKATIRTTIVELLLQLPLSFHSIFQAVFSINCVFYNDQSKHEPYVRGYLYTKDISCQNIM